MNKTNFERITLAKGEMNVYDFGTIRLHAYKTNDFIDDEVFIVEKNGTAVLIESPCFHDNNRELAAYLEERNLSIAGMLLAYHMAGASFLPETKKYATKNADEYGHSGGGKALIDNFANTFGDSFDAAIHTVTDYLKPGETAIGDIVFQITPTQEAFDIEIPEINAVYTHMLGHDCHSIVAGPDHADAIIGKLEKYIEMGYTLILTSHYTPEDLKDVRTKISYLQKLKAIAARHSDAGSFKEEVKGLYPDFSGENYLDMTAGFFYAK